ncbi:MAG: Uma2 family endonuclease [Calothrix sp. FI2-JRJ7]|jgi:Uma2 family endonuclease|nr:Uma2 family endonuclease [Calothrix sp. FI2-JRJ7]
MTTFREQLKPDIIYPHSDGKPMAESDPARDYLIYGVEALDIYYQNRTDVYVSGNLYIYYTQGVPSDVVAPDVFVVFGVRKKKRLTYKVWEEGYIVPSFVLEVTSATTQENDQKEKSITYASIGVSNYFQYDPTGDYLNPHLQGFKLNTASRIYERIEPDILPDGTFSLHSDALNLDLRLIYDELRFFDPVTGNKLLSPKETEQARQESEKARYGAIPQLLARGLSIEEAATILSLSVEQVRQYLEK